VVGRVTIRKLKLVFTETESLPGWTKNEVGKGSVIPKNTIALGVEHGMETFNNGPCGIIISFLVERSNNGGRRALSRTQEGIKDTSSTLP
jgi:hypothetical protein